MESNDVAVIGASAAGLFTAGRLAVGGRDVSVLERAPTLNPARRALIVTGKMLDLLGPDSRDCVVNEIGSFELFADGKSAHVELGRPDLIIERATLIEQLAERAQAAGVRVMTRSRFVSFEPADRGVTIQTSSNGDAPRSVTARTIVGADGARSRVARAAGWSPPGSVSLVQALVELPEDLPARTARVWFRPQDTPYFYWLIPEADGRGALGVIGEEPGEIRVRLDAFLDERDLKALSYQAAMIPVYDRWMPAHRKVGESDVYLVGDAAAQVKVSTVGGIVTGFRGAQAVVDSILHGRRRELRKLRLELDVHRLIRRALTSFSEDDYRYLIGGMTAATNRALRASDRDEAARALLRFVRAKPGVTLRAVRAMLLNGKGPR